jgi:hypothetical protein
MQQQPEKQHSPRTIAPSLQQIADVHDNGIFDGRRLNEFARVRHVLDFQSAAVILEE